eukprot:UN24037
MVFVSSFESLPILRCDYSHIGSTPPYLANCRNQDDSEAHIAFDCVANDCSSHYSTLLARCAQETTQNLEGNELGGCTQNCVLWLVEYQTSLNSCLPTYDTAKQSIMNRFCSGAFQVQEMK